MKLSLFIIFLTLVTSLSSFAAQKRISRHNFNEVVRIIDSIYSREFENRNVSLYIDATWNSDVFNAFAYRPRPYIWEIQVNGALGRSKEMTPDAFAFILCHEMGHHIGGIPKAKETSWAAAEGQADYFSASRCLKKVLSSYAAKNWETGNISFDIKNICAKNYINLRKQTTCQRIIKAGEIFTKTFADLKSVPAPSIMTPEKSSVAETLRSGYPSIQCRLDTIVAGALCSPDLSNYPDDFEINVGFCSEGAGSRPKCWFNPATLW